MFISLPQWVNQKTVETQCFKENSKGMINVECMLYASTNIENIFENRQVVRTPEHRRHSVILTSEYSDRTNIIERL